MAWQNRARIHWFLEAGIDDLAKYRVVELLVHTPGICGGGDFFSETLGLKPLHVVCQRLEELTDRGLLARYARASNRSPVYSISADPAVRRRLGRLYRLSADPAVRRRLGRLYRLSADPAIRVALLDQLARRSLRRTAALAKSRRSTARVEEPALVLAGGAPTRGVNQGLSALVRRLCF